MTRFFHNLFFVLIVFGALSLRCEAALFSVSDQDVIDAGKQAHQEVMSQYGAWNDAAQQDRVDRLGKNMTRFSTRPEIQYQFYLLNTDILNALATPDGSIHITRGLLEHFTDNHLLEFVLGHEMTHVELRHGKQAIEEAMQTQAEGNILLLLLGKNSTAAQMGINGAALWLNMKYSRDHEYQADEGGMKLLKAAGIDPHYGPKALQTLFEVSQAQPGLLDKYFGTHPLPQDRIPRAQQVADQLQPPAFYREAPGSNSGSMAESIGSGTLRGKISIHQTKGSIKPVPMLYPQMTLIAYDENNNILVKTHPTRQGYYRLSLPAGTYVYSYYPDSLTLVFSRINPSNPSQSDAKEVVVRANSVTSLNFR